MSGYVLVRFLKKNLQLGLRILTINLAYIVYLIVKKTFNY